MNWVHPTALLLATMLAAFAQCWFGGFRGWFGVQPDVLPALVVYAALTTSLTTTTAVAVVGGLGLDALSSGPFGLGILPLISLGMVLHRRRDLVLRRSRLAQATLGAGASLGVAVSSVVLLYLIWPLLSSPDSTPPFWPEYRHGETAAPGVGIRLLWQLFVLGVAGAALTPLVFRFFGWVDDTFNYRPAVEPAHRPDREIKRGRS